MAKGSANGNARRKTTKTATKSASAKPGAASSRSKRAPAGRGTTKQPRSRATPATARRRVAAAPVASAARDSRESRFAEAAHDADGERAPIVSIRPVRPADLAQVIAIDSIVTGLEKIDYWRTIHRRYGDAERAGRRFLVADANGSVAGFVIGEVRDWEFGSPPCGWVFAIDVHPKFRLAGLGTQLVGAMADWFRSEGVGAMRTILSRDNTLILSFFRSLGMTTGPFIPLEIDLAQPGFFPFDAERAR